MAGPEVKVVVNAAIDGFIGAMDKVDRSMASARKNADAMASRFRSMGDTLDRVGKRMSVVSAGIAATAGGAFLLAKGTADSAKEIQNLARVANTGTTEFQRMAAGAETVGIEQDKLADILKDVNDRVGDFMSTGGGPMKDFFEQIAPKVGVTADQFAKLSGPDALQLYVDSLQKAGVSQQQMTFYMEAMASDATALVPLLKDSGAGMAALGDAAEKSGRVMSESAIAKSNEFNASLRNLQGGFQGVKDQFAVTLMPVMTQLMDRINADVLPAIASVVETIGGWITAFGDLPGPVQDAAAAIGLALGVGGPVLVAIGAASTAIGALIGAAGPVGLLIAAAATLTAAWAMWGDDFKAAVGGAVDWVSGKFTALMDTLQSVIDKAVAVKNAIRDALLPQGEFQGGTWSGGGGAEPDLGQGFGIGQNLGQGIIGGLGQSIADGDQAIRDYINQVPAIAREELGIKSPSRVFAEIGNFMGQGMAQGIGESTAMVAAAAASMGRVAVAQADASVSEVLSSMGQLFQGSKKLSAGIALANSWLAFTEVLKDPAFIGRPWARFAAAASALSAGLNAVQNIKNAQPGGTGGGSAGGGATSGGTSAQTPPTQTFVIDAPGINLESFVAAFRQAQDAGYRLDLRTA